MSYKHNGGYHRGRPSVATAADSKLNLLVRFLDHGVDDSQFRVFFEPFGEITSSMVMRDIFTGESRGFGFVRFARSADAARALRECDGKRLGGKAVNVIWAKQQHDDTPAGQERLKMNKLFLRNVPLGVTEAELVALLRVYGTVTEASLHSDKIPAARHAPARRIAFIMFADEGAAEAALRGVHNTCPFPTCNGIPLMGKLRAPAILFTDHAHLPPMLDCAFCTFTAKQVGGACSPTPASSVHLSDSAAEDSLFSPSAVVAGGSQADGVIAEQEAMARYSPALRLSTLRLPAPTLPKVFRHNPYAASLIAPRRNSG
ncbi:RNA recognition motif family protein [Leishmania donovani]|uniref:RNA recognition motif family protein n=1 Tax=Leishmania donovani TaxID=5661 RepID=A0A504XZZ4_LEIDO|nr:RNA recognition motif family protein [Leishmania donovani]